MGQSSSAHLAFGFDLGDELPESIEDMDLDVLAREESGLIKPESPDNSYSGPEWDAWRIVCQKARENYPVQILHHGYDFSGYFLALKKSVKYADWEGPLKIVDFHFPSHDDTILLKNWCESHGVKYQEPAWHLMAHYA